MSQKIQLEMRDHTALLTIANPPANTWDRESLAALEQTIGQLNDNPDVYALVITGEGEKFFSAGADLKQFADGNKQNAQEVAALFGRAFEALSHFRGVSIAAINGYAMGGDSNARWPATYASPKSRHKWHFRKPRLGCCPAQAVRRICHGW